MVRRGVLQDGLLLYQSRGLLERQYTESGVLLAATERTAAFLDILETEYAIGLRERASWLVAAYGAVVEKELGQIVQEQHDHASLDDVTNASTAEASKIRTLLGDLESTLIANEAEISRLG